LSGFAGWSFVTNPLYEGYVIDSHLTAQNPSASKAKPSNGSKSKYKDCTELRKDYPNGVGRDHSTIVMEMDGLF